MRVLKQNKWVVTVIVLLLFGVLMYFSFRLSPVELIQSVGPGKVYLVLFFISLFSAVSTLTSTPFYASLVIAITGGLNPLLVALVVAPAVCIGDMVFLYLVESGAEALSRRIGWMQRIHNWLQDRSDQTVKIVTFLFFGLVPISSDLFLTVLALIGVKPRDIWPYVFLGNITFFALLGFLVDIGSPVVTKIIS